LNQVELKPGVSLSRLGLSAMHCGHPGLCA